jgi:molecular chaperone HscB
MNHFEFYEIPVSFNPDMGDLKQRYLKYSKLFHPDFHTLESEEKQAQILEKSTQNNQAYQVLSDFDLRLKYVLELHGMLDEGKNELPQEFLLEMMDINEAIMELEFDFEESVFDRTLQNVEALENAMMAEVRPILEAYSEGNMTNKELEPVKDFFLKRRYLWRIKENLNKFAPASKEAR